MSIQLKDHPDFQIFISAVEGIIAGIKAYTQEKDINGLNRLIENFKLKTEDFYRENRKLNIGVVGQVKAGKSSFLNTLLFGGREILPKASTPKTATLTKMEYSEENAIEIEYYSEDEWSTLEDNARVDLDDEIYSSARELVEMVRRNGIDPHEYLSRGKDRISFDSYEELISRLNDYVGEDGQFTPIVKAVTLSLHNEEFQGLSIVDTPGLNDPIASRTIRTKEFMEVCDVVFFLSQSGSFLDKSDWILLSSQLPQKGVRRLVLIASKYDSGIRDILREQDEDDIFGDDDNVADTIPGACKIIRKKLKKRARSKVEEFVKDLETRGSSQDLINVIRQCADPIMVSSISYNMYGKAVDQYSPEEKNIYSALKKFSRNMEKDLKLLSNFDEVKSLFDDVIREKEQILEIKARNFVPNAKEELKGLLTTYLERTGKRIQVLESNDREQLLSQKKMVEEQMGNIRADIASVFGELNAKLEAEKGKGVRELRSAGKDYLNIKERSGTKTIHESYTVSDSRWYNPFSWGTSHVEHYTYQEHYSYCIAADAIENLRRYSLDACSHVERVFSEAMQIKDIKRRLLDVVVKNFDLGSDKFDSSLFRVLVEDTVSQIEFPVFNMDIAEAMNGIAGKFTGEITSAEKKTELSTALMNAISRICDRLTEELESSVRKYRNELDGIRQKVEDNLLTNITEEFDLLAEQCGNKEKEISGFKEYAGILEGALAKL